MNRPTRAFSRPPTAAAADARRYVLRVTTMFQLLMEVFGPSVFAKGLLKYKQGKYQEAQKLILRAGRWMPDLKKDNFYRAALLLVESNLNEHFPKSRYREAFESLTDSPYMNTGDFAIVVEDLKRQIKGST